MHHYLSKDNHIFKFSAHAAPGLAISSGDSVTFETMDCFTDQVQGPGDSIEQVSFDRINPATGPVFVKGARAGDVLKVAIDGIRVKKQAVMLTGKDLGVLGDAFDKMHLKVLPIEKGELIFDDRTRLPIDPMVGVIGVAPAGEPVNCGTPDRHGGNMDTNLIREKASVYLPVYVEGALLALGDLHALMGDGEVAVTGAEVAGEVDVTVSVIKKFSLQTPLVANDDVLAVIASRKSLDDAVTESVKIMEKLIRERTNLPREEIVMLLSLTGRAAVSQVVDPLKTARFEMPWQILGNYGFNLY